MSKSSTLFRISIILLFSILIGVLSGAVTTLFGRILLAIGDIRASYFSYLIFFLALAGVAIIFLYQKWGKNAQKGMGLIFEVGHGGKETIPKRLIPLVMLTTWLTHLFGGSAGREGVAVQLGATIAHQIEKKSPVQLDSNLFLLVGIAAGFAGLFQTPLAASFFAIEVLIIGHYSLTALLPALVAAFTASSTSHFLGLEKFQFPLANTFQIDGLFLLKLVILGLVFALIGNTFALALQKTKSYLAQLLPNPYLRIALVGLCLSFAFFFLHHGRYSGLGTNLIEESLNGETIYAYDWLLKLLLTVLTLAAGFQGGEVTPLFAIGASSGVVAASLLGLPIELAAALGYMSVFGVATNTLLAPIFIGIEVFGWQSAPYYILVVAIAHFVNRKHSIYGAQKLESFRIK